MGIDKGMLMRMKNLMKNSSVKDEYKCDNCRDLGYVFVKDEKGNDVAKPCDCLAKRRMEEMLCKCGLSEAFREKTFGNYVCEVEEQYAAKHRAMKYCKCAVEDRKSLLICGSAGRGKTHLGVASMLYFINHGTYCKYLEYNAMMMNLKQCVMDKVNFELEMEKILSPSFIFIDDFLKGNVTSSDLNYIYRIVNSRYLSRKPMIISTEKSVEEIIAWDEAVGSRLVEMAGENIISFYGDARNYRLRNYNG